MPWHPLLWWAKSRLVRLSEQACDDWVVATGQPCTDYAESLLDLTPGGQMAFVPAVVSSKRGLAGRVRRILKDSCGNPRTGTTWALIVSLVVLCLTVGIAFAQTRPDRTEYISATQLPSSEVRIVHFPKDRSLGTLKLLDRNKNRNKKRQIATFDRWIDNFSWWADWEYLGEAKGDVTVPANNILGLEISPEGWRDLSPLSRLKPDDLYELRFLSCQPGLTKAGDRCMKHIEHLTGLKVLDLRYTNITSKSMRFIRNFKSLERLYSPERITNEGLAYVAELQSLRGLYFSRTGGSQVTNTGLHHHLARLTSLQELELVGDHIGNAGLMHIRHLPKLRYLLLMGKNFSDTGMAHLKNVPSLRILQLGWLPQLTDAALVHLSQIPKLERLSLHWNENITDVGIAHLKKLRSLKMLYIGRSQVTDEGLAHLKEIKSLEDLDLPNKGITDTGLIYISELSNLKRLDVSRRHYVDPSRNKEYYTDKGLAELAKCRLLEDLSIGSIGITDAGIEHIIKLTNLKKLNLFGCDNVTDAGLAKLTALKSLSNLYIHAANLTIAGLNALKPMPNLTHLNVSHIKRDGTVLDISGLTALEDLSLSLDPYSEDKFIDADLMCLAKLKRLRWLTIGPRDYTDKGMLYLAGLTNMERLGIGGSGLTDEGLKYLANMKKLDHLTILTGWDKSKRTFGSGGNITDKGLREFEKIKSLRSLNIYTDSKLSPAAIQHLRRELPNLTFLTINGRDSLGRSYYPKTPAK